MSRIPLEDECVDIVGKAQRGLQIGDAALAETAGLSQSELGAARAGTAEDAAIANLAGALELGPQALIESAREAWHPAERSVTGLAQFNTRFHDMFVNAYLVWDPATRLAGAFDTGADCQPMMDCLRENDLRLTAIFLTHVHRDHIADLERLRSAYPAPIYVSVEEAITQAEPFEAGRQFQIGKLTIDTLLTSGHSIGGITYTVNGLDDSVAIVGDALFAGSMGGGIVSYQQALKNNRQKILTLPEATVICPGHGPISTVKEEKAHNPFFPEFQNH